MKLSDIKKLRDRILPIKSFIEEIANEVQLYKQSLKIKGSSASILLIEDVNIKIGVEDINFLCEIFLGKEIDNWTFNYVVESLLLTDKVTFENEVVEEALRDLTDSELGLKLTNKYVKEIQNTLD